VFVLDKNGTAQVLWVQGAGKWRGPLAISPTGFVPAGGTLSASRQFGVANQTDVFIVTNGGALQVVWVDGAGKWNGPHSI
jgi:hypothetical protein